MSFMKPDYDTLVGSIYDCAANPELWPDTLTLIRDALNGAYAMIGFADTSPMQHQLPPVFTFRHSPWDRKRLLELSTVSLEAPGLKKVLDGNIDQSWTQMENASRQEFEKTEFNRTWAEPQGLTDALVVPYVNKQNIVGMLSIAKHKSKGQVFLEAERNLAERLSAHIRRAIVINDIADKGRLAATLYRQVLDSLSVAVFIIGLGRRVVFTNASGDAMLRENSLVSIVNQKFQARRVVGLNTALDDAIDRALKGDIAVGIFGIGVPLLTHDDNRAAAYVLPISGKDVRAEMGIGHCVVFVARRGEHQPMAIEVLRSMYDLTPTEARVALLLAKGEGSAEIAQTLAISNNTVRTHLKRAFAKTSTSDQLSLGSLVAALLPPVNGAA